MELTEQERLLIEHIRKCSIEATSKINYPK